MKTFITAIAVFSFAVTSPSFAGDVDSTSAHETQQQAPQGTFQRAGQRADELLAKGKEKLKSASDKTKEKLKEASTKVKDGLSAAGEAVKRKAAELGGKAKEKASEAAAAAKEKSGEIVDSVKENALPPAVQQPPTEPQRTP
jgi:hypothetical protein